MAVTELSAAPAARIDGSRLARGSHALRLDGVGRQFGALVALSGVSFTVQPGERVGIIGANGAGKTTLFNAITGDFPPTTGRIFLFGEDVTDLAPHHRIRRGLRRTYQSSLLFRSLSVADNLYLAVRGVTRGRFSLLRTAIDAPTRVAARELAHMVHLDDHIDRPVGELSYGQQRQLELGLALAGAPRLVLFDEPAAGLSPVERRDLSRLLSGLPAHMGYVLIEHDLDLALRLVDRVLVMHNGQLIKEGSPGSIESDPDVQRIYLGHHRHG